ncbi:TPA: hypothetical protein HA244_03560 [Candidatus Micrarchaeota archaeon]|nr:hypothetical protein [Candidatus Micrarchaeota archaeon]
MAETAGISKNKPAAIALIAVVALAAIALFTSQQPAWLEKNFAQLYGQAQAPILNPIETPAGQEGNTTDTRSDGQVQASLTRDSLPPPLFSLLPEMPEDFFEKREQIRNGKITLGQFSDLGESYWLQPEFYPNFEDRAIGEILRPPSNRWAVQGFGAYPSQASAQAKPGQRLAINVFFKTSWLVESYQGIRLEPTAQNRSQIASPDFQKNIRVEISPQEFLLEPAYPAFSKGWAKKIGISISISPEAEEGEYEIGFNPVKPLANEEWGSQHRAYFSATGFGIGRPFFAVKLSVKR